jgi:hypothetical protein
MSVSPPGGNCTCAITHTIEQAKIEILVQAFSLTSKPIADAVAKAKETGVTVEIILDLSDDFARNSAAYFSSLKGIPTYLDAKHVIADNKIIIFDKATVVTSSFKFTNNADGKDASNLLIIKSGTLAAACVDNWNQHKKHSVKSKKTAQYKDAKREPGKKKRDHKSDNKGGCFVRMAIFSMAFCAPLILFVKEPFDRPVNTLLKVPLRTGPGNFPPHVFHKGCQHLLGQLGRRGTARLAEVGQFDPLQGDGLRLVPEGGDADVDPAALDNELSDDEPRIFASGFLFALGLPRRIGFVSFDVLLENTNVRRARRVDLINDLRC